MDCVQSGRMVKFYRVFPGDLGVRGRLVSWILLCVFHFMPLPVWTGAVGHNVEWNEVMEAGPAWIYDATFCKTGKQNCINSGEFLRNYSKAQTFFSPLWVQLLRFRHLRRSLKLAGWWLWIRCGTGTVPGTRSTMRSSALNRGGVWI